MDSPIGEARPFKALARLSVILKDSGTPARSQYRLTAANAVIPMM
jgi:hypothetical protein